MFLASCASAPFSLTTPIVSGRDKSLSVSGLLPRGFAGPVREENSAHRRSSTYSKRADLSLKITAFSDVSDVWRDEAGEGLTDEAMKERLASIGTAVPESVQTIDYISVDGIRWPVRAIVDRSGCRYVFGCKYSGGAILVEVSAHSTKLMRQQRKAMLSVLKSLRLVQRSRSPALEPSMNPRSGSPSPSTLRPLVSA